MRGILAFLGVVLFILGGLAFAGVGIPTEEGSIEIGSLEASIEEKRTVPPVVAAIAMATGVIMVGFAARKPR